MIINKYSKRFKNFSLNKTTPNLNNLFPFQLFFLITKYPSTISTSSNIIIFIISSIYQFLIQKTHSLFITYIFIFTIKIFIIFIIPILQNPIVILMINNRLISANRIIRCYLNMTVKISTYQYWSVIWYKFHCFCDTRTSNKFEHKLSLDYIFLIFIILVLLCNLIFLFFLNVLILA